MIEPTSIIAVPWPITASGTLALLTGAARFAQVVVQRRNGNGKDPKVVEALAGIERLERHWLAAEPMFRQTVETLAVATRTLDMRTPLLENLVKVAEGLSAQFRQHDQDDKVTFAEISGRLDAVQKSLDEVEVVRRRR